jgi:glycosyltransferase involved in cell wall biosynthesis
LRVLTKSGDQSVSGGKFWPADFEKIARPHWIGNSRGAVLKLSREDWVPDAPAAGTELMLAGLKERLGEDLERINLNINHPGTDTKDTRPRVVWMHHDVNQDWVQWCRDKSLVGSVDHFVFVSHWQRERYLREFDLPPERCRVLQNATETNASPREWESVPVRRCAFTSTPFRGLSVLLDAWHQLNPDSAELHIWSSMKLYLGDDTPYAHLYDRAREMPNVCYHGIIPNADLRAALRHIDFLIYPSTFAETSCLAVIEAMSAGCRVIVPALGALPETTAGYAHVYPSVPDKEKHAEILAEILNMELRRPWDGSPELSLSQQLHCAAVYDWDRRANDWRGFIASITCVNNKASGKNRSAPQVRE